MVDRDRYILEVFESLLKMDATQLKEVVINLTEAVESYKPSIPLSPAKGQFNHDFFRTAPAMASLHLIQQPHPELVRACLLELTRYVLALPGVNDLATDLKRK